MVGMQPCYTGSNRQLEGGPDVDKGAFHSRSASQVFGLQDEDVVDGADEDDIDSRFTYHELGDLWISADRHSVEWRVSDQIIKKFTQQKQIIKAGFVKFELSDTCLVIVVNSHACIYQLSNGKLSTVAFPFHICEAFWYSNGVVLEKEMLGDTQSLIDEISRNRFITLTDPMSPFGLVTILEQNSNDDLTDFYFDSKILLFANDENGRITVMYNEKTSQLSFFYTKVTAKLKDEFLESLSSPATTTASNNTNKFTEQSNKKIKLFPKLNNRRATSQTTASHYEQQQINENTGNQFIASPTRLNETETFMNNENNGNITNTYKNSPFLELPIVSQTITAKSTRSISATLDRMSGNPITPTTMDFPSTSTTQQLQNDFLGNGASTTDITLIKISSMKLNQMFIKEIKCIPLRNEDSEAVVIFSKKSSFFKIWSVHLSCNNINSITAKIHNEFPQRLINVLDFDFSEIPDKVIPLNFKELPGFVIILHKRTMSLSLLNPFTELPILTTPIPNKFQQHIEQLCTNPAKLTGLDTQETPNLFNLTKSLLPWPSHKSIQLYFSALKWVCPLSFYYTLVLLWQQIFVNLTLENEIKLNLNESILEFTAFYELMKLIIQIISGESPLEYTDLNHVLYIDQLQKNILLPKIVLCLHLIREELVLNVFCQTDVDQLGDLLHFMVYKLNWPSNWKDYYKSTPTKQTIIEPLSNFQNFTFPLDEPPSIFKSLYSITEKSQIPITPFINFSRLVDKDYEVDKLLTPRSFKLISLYESIHSREFTLDILLDILNDLEITKEEIETYPLGVITPIKNMIKTLEFSIASLDSKKNLSVLARFDLKKSFDVIKLLKANEDSLSLDHSMSNTANFSSHKSVSTESPKDIGALLQDIVNSASNSSNDEVTIEKEDLLGDADEGYFLKHNAGLIFSEDRRFNVALTMLVYYKPRKVQFHSKETEYIKIIEQKKQFAKLFSLRNFTAGIGWGAVAYATEKPLSTQKWNKPKLNLTSIFPDGTRITPTTTELDEESFRWGEFHGGVSSGLQISRKAKNINGSWISFNKPRKLDAQHGGFLFGLGLNGHLKNLEEWHVYNYLSPKNTHVSIGLLLGMSASLKGTMDIKLTKVLSVHVVALLPTGSNDLNINIKVQTAGLVGIGMLYEKSQHKKMSELLLSQISSVLIMNEEPVADEAYRIAAGISLGLINLGVRNSLISDDIGNGTDDSINLAIQEHPASSNNSGLNEPLLRIAVESYDREPDWAPGNSQIGAVMALILINLKSKNHTVADKLKCSTLNKDDSQITTRPEVFMYREWAYHMIMWDTAEPSMAFLLEGFDAATLKTFSTDCLPTYYMLAGRALSLGIKYASVSDENLRDILLTLIDKFLPFYQYPGTGKADFKLTITGLNSLINVLLVSVSMIMCGSGDLKVLQRVRYLSEVVTGKYSDLYKPVATKVNDFDSSLHSAGAVSIGEGPADVSINEVTMEASADEDYTVDPAAESEQLKDDENHYAKYLCANMVTGFLFLGSGQYALKTSDLTSIGYLIIAVMPTYLSPFTLQELKHFWCLAVEPRCLITRNVESEESINGVHIEVTLKSKLKAQQIVKTLITPCLLPELQQIKKIKVNSPDYYPLELQFTEELTAAQYFRNSIVLHLQKYDEFDEEARANNRSIQKISLKDRLMKKAHQKFSKDFEMTEKPANSLDLKILSEKLSLIDLPLLEIRYNMKKFGENENDQQRYDLDMIYSNRYGGDTKDYRLDLWALNHGQT